MVVRATNRGPYVPGKSIVVSRATADRLNLMPTTKLKFTPFKLPKMAPYQGQEQ